jgi:hypothetical protein
LGKGLDSTDPDETVVAAMSGRDNLSGSSGHAAVEARSDGLSFAGLGKAPKNYLNYLAIARGAIALRMAKKKIPPRFR